MHNEEEYFSIVLVLSFKLILLFFKFELSEISINSFSKLFLILFVSLLLFPFNLIFWLKQISLLSISDNKLLNDICRELMSLLLPL